MKTEHGDYRCWLFEVARILGDRAEDLWGHADELCEQLWADRRNKGINGRSWRKNV